MPKPLPTQPPAAKAASAGFDTGSHESFYEYYKKQSLSPETVQRFAAIAEVVLRIRTSIAERGAWDVIDIGCGAGTQARIWTDLGHRYTGIDINEPLVRLARERAAEDGRDARYEVSSATALPFADASFDICLLPELLEHIAEWKEALEEAVRVLRPGGVLYVSTSNKLCPKQQEFNLIGYSWYPAFAKRYFERRAVTDWPALANHAKYPAVNWFSYLGLRAFFAQRGMRSFDRFDSMRLDNKPASARWLVSAFRAVPPLRFLGHMLTPETVIVAQRGSFVA